MVTSATSGSVAWTILVKMS